MLSRDAILRAFQMLSGELGQRGVLSEVNFVEGTAMVLAFNARTFTKDVGAIFASRTVEGNLFEFEFADFLHEFLRSQDVAMLTDAPVLLQGHRDLGAVYDAYLAAAAVSLSASLNCWEPAWAREPERILRNPWFAKPGHHMRALLLVESPAAFRERNLFVTANVLSMA